MKYITHSNPPTGLNEPPPKRSWNDLLQEAVASLPEAVATAKRLTPSIERLTPVAQDVNTYIPWLTVGVWLLGGAILGYTLKKVS
jgi:hypothetical protein